MPIDAHAQIDRYDPVTDRAPEAAPAEIARNGIFTVGNSMAPDSCLRDLEIAGKCDRILPVFGMRPWNAPGLMGIF
jgi:hypothetical protein